jgi:hypothetical protein
MELDAQNLKEIIACDFDLVFKRLSVVVDQTEFPSVLTFTQQFVL